MAGVAIWLVSRAQGYSALVDHTYQVEATLNQFSALTELAETARRGYLLVPNRSYREKYDQARAGIGPLLDRIEAQTADNPVERQYVAQLRALSEERAELVSRMMDFAEAGRMDEAVEAFKQDHNQKTLDPIRGLIRKMMDEEAHLLTVRTARETENADILLGVVLIGGALLAVLALSSMLIMNRYADDLDRTQSQLRLLNAGLEARVLDRTEALSAANIRLEAIVDRQAILLQEVNHRVANSLQLVSSLVNMQLSAVKDGPAREALRDTQARIGAIMQVHRRLYTSDDVQFVDMKGYLDGLMTELSQSLGAEGRRTLTLDAAPIRLPTDMAVSLGVVVAELVTNACKYAYPANQVGEVRVLLNTDHEGLHRLVVEDDGRGFSPADPVQGTGLGRKVISAMTKNLQSTIKYDPCHAGARAVLTFKA